MIDPKTKKDINKLIKRLSKGLTPKQRIDLIEIVDSVYRASWNGGAMSIGNAVMRANGIEPDITNT